MTPELTRRTAKVVVTPIWHDAGGRITRRTWAANIAPSDDEADESLTRCEHSMGHRTTEAAVACGTAMWKQLPAS